MTEAQAAVPWQWTYGSAALGGLLGLVLGAVFGLNGIAQPATASALGQSPRIKNLLWLFSGILPALTLDIRKLGVPPGFPLYGAAFAYGICACLGAAGAVSWMLGSITRSVLHFNRSHPGAAQVDAGELRREYLTFGKARFEDRWAQRQAAALAEGFARQRRLELDADQLAARCVHCVVGHMRLPSAKRRVSEGPLIDTILAAIIQCARVHAASSDLTLKASYMAFITTQRASPEQRAKALFTEDMPEACLGYLELRRGGFLAVAPVVPILPVAAEPHTLPGAPEAVMQMSNSIMNLPIRRFRPEISPAAQREVQRFYQDQYYRNIQSITSLAMHDGNEVFGVVNIESSAPHLLGSEASASEALARLQTLIALLSCLR